MFNLFDFQFFHVQSAQSITTAPMLAWTNVRIYSADDDASTSSNDDDVRFTYKCTATVDVDQKSGMMIIKDGEREIYRQPYVSFDVMPIARRRLALRPKGNTDVIIMQFPDAENANRFFGCITNRACVTASGDVSLFDARTEQSSAVQYFQFYGYLSQQQNMMQDYVRTSTYQRAIMSNLSDFKNKIVLDVGAGSGILSFFAVQAGAKKVYAVEASSMAQHCQTLVAANKLQEHIQVIAGKIEEVNIPEKVDTIISEPMGYMLLNERMIESYLHAKKFMKPNGKLFPSRGDLYMAPFSDEQLFLEQNTKAAFWSQSAFHGVNLESLKQEAFNENLRQPIVDTWHVGILLAEAHLTTFDFQRANEQQLHEVTMEKDFTLDHTAFVHGFAFWFDVAFIGSSETVWLSTAPTEPLTHWYQVRCMLRKPLLVRAGEKMYARVIMKANQRQSYDVELTATNADGDTSMNELDLKNPYFRYTGAPVQPPPGFNTSVQSPSVQVHAQNQAYWQQVASVQQQTYALLPQPPVAPANAPLVAATSSPVVTSSSQWQPGVQSPGAEVINGTAHAYTSDTLPAVHYGGVVINGVADGMRTSVTYQK